MGRRTVAVLIGLMVCVVPAVAVAQDATDPAAAKFRSGEEVEIGPGETVPDDVYVAGGTIRVVGTVDGDLIATGGQVDVIGTVTGDLIAAGGGVTVDGRVDGDARVAGGSVTVTGEVGEDVVAGTGTLTVTADSRVGGDLVFSTAETVLDGAVAGDVRGSTTAYTASGDVGGTEDVVVERDADTAPGPLDRVWSAVRRWVGLVLVGALLIWLAPAVMERARAAARARPLPSLGLGQLAVIGVPLVLLVGLFVVVLAAIALGLVALTQLAGALVATGVVVVLALAMVFVLLVWFVAQVIVSLLLGRLVLPARGRGDQLVATALGALVLVILFAIPVGGALVQYAVVLLGLGALLLGGRSRVAGDAAGTDTAPTPVPSPTAASGEIT